MLINQILDKGDVVATDTSTMSRADWLNLRKQGIGGSDAGAILGFNKYKTPLSVYLDKKSNTNFDGNKATEWGNILEDPIRQKTREELEVEIETVSVMLSSKQYSFMTANLDGLIFVDGEKEIAGNKISGLGGHEIKTSRTGDGFSEDEIPDSYYAQVQHYMAVTGLEWFVLTVFIFDKYEGKHYVISRNDEFIDSLIEREKDFWENNVLAEIAPSPEGTANELELVKSLPTAAEIILGKECESLLNEKDLLDSQIAELQKKSDQIKTEIILRIAENSAGDESAATIATCGDWKISYKTQVAKRVDTSALKKAGVYDTYSKPSVSKVLKITRA